MNYKLIFNLVLVGLLVIFIVQNVAVVEIRFLKYLFQKGIAFQNSIIILALVVGEC